MDRGRTFATGSSGRAVGVPMPAHTPPHTPGSMGLAGFTDSVDSETVAVRRSVGRRILHRSLWRASRWLFVSVAFLTTAITAETFAGPRVRVVATTRVEVRGAETEAGVKVFGRLVDDTGAGLGGAEIHVRVANGEAPTSWLALPPPPPPAKGLGREDILVTSPDGSFALEIPFPNGAWVVDVRTEETPWMTPAHATLRLDPGMTQVELSFLPPPAPPAAIDLDAARVKVSVHVAAEGIPQNGFAIKLHTQGRTIGRALSNRGVATFDLATSDFGAPGSGYVDATFSGAAGFATSNARSLVRRSAVARFQDVRLADPRRVLPSEGVRVVGRVASRAGVPASGVVEATVAGERVGVAPVREGNFGLVAHWRAEEDGTARVSLHFTPAGEGWIVSEQGADLLVDVRTPGPWRAIAAALAGIALVLVVIRSRRAPTFARGEAASPDGGEVVRVARRARAPRVVELVVRDRRRRVPVVGAQVRASRPSAVAVEKIGEGETDHEGKLRLVLTHAARPGDQLLVTHRAYLPLAIELPRASELELATTRRRDAVLDALVAWARGRSEESLPLHPTPGEIVSFAERELRDPSRTAAVAWGTAVERAAFEMRDLDEGAQRGIEAMASSVVAGPKIPAPPPRKRG